MSLISQRDREIAIQALNYYIASVTDENDNERKALVNWIKLEHYKHTQPNNEVEQDS